MNIDDLKKLKVIDLKNLIRNYKKTSCPAFSKLKKLDLINLIIKLNISQSRSPSESQSQSRSRPRSPSPEIVDKTLKENALKLVVKKIASNKKKFEKLPPDTILQKQNRTGKREKISEKIDELLDVQKYLNRIYRDNITEKLNKQKIKILL